MGPAITVPLASAPAGAESSVAAVAAHRREVFVMAAILPRGRPDRTGETPKPASEPSEQPLVDGWDALRGEREMTVVRGDASVGVRNRTGEPLAVRDGDEPVLAPVPHQGGHRDVGQGEAVLAHDGQVVVDP